mmetsp:Transcript_49080/g.96222  ORF Transcript_49080/g.96222 Transcript_49080/m.96222 type:complete len:127 (+) Transcript_49080:56-436(+)
MWKVIHFVVDRMAEPFSTGMEAVARKSNLFRRGCVGLARYLNANEVKRESHFFYGETASFEPLGEEEAARRGASMMGEAVLWSIGLGILYHQHLQEVEAEDELERRIVALESRLDALTPSRNGAQT